MIGWDYKNTLTFPETLVIKIEPFLTYNCILCCVMTN